MYRTAEFNKTTVRLLAEFIEKTGQNATIVNMDSFLEFFAYLNPTAPIPTVPEIVSFIYFFFADFLQRLEKVNSFNIII